MSELINNIRESVDKFRKKELEKNCKYWEFEERGLPDNYIKQIDSKLGIVNLRALTGDEDFLEASSVIISLLAKSCVSLAFLFAQHYSVLSTVSLFKDNKFISVFIPYVTEGSVLYINQKDRIVGETDFLLGHEFADIFIIPVYDENDNRYIITVTGELSVEDSLDFMPGLSVLNFGKIHFTTSKINKITKFSKVKNFEEYRDKLYKNMLRNQLSVYSGILAVAYDIIKKYVNERKQGGVLIVEHSPVRNIVKNIGYVIAEVESTVKVLIERPENSKEMYFAIVDKVEDALIDSIQCLGGYGYMEDYGLEKLLRDFRSVKSLFTEQFG